MGKAKRFDCKICGLNISSYTLGVHCKAKHNMNSMEYKKMFGELPEEKTYNCKNCGKDISDLHYNSKYCCDECKDEFKVKVNNEKFKDNPNTPTCKICGMKKNNLTPHITKVHKMKMKEYYEKFNCTSKDVICGNMLKEMSERVKGDKNPSYKHNGTLSPFSMDFKKYEGLTDEEKIEKIEKVKSKVKKTKDKYPHKRGNNNIYYFINKGYSEDEAKVKLSERQSTFSKKKCIEKYGKEEGLKVWKERQRKWLNSYKKLNYSKVSQELFWELYGMIKDDFEEIYFAQLGPRKGKDDSGKNHEYKLDIGDTFCKPDFFIKDKNLIIEFDGDYWHGQNGNIKREKERNEKLLNEGYKVLHIKEYDWNNDRLSVLQKCKEFIYG